MCTVSIVTDQKNRIVLTSNRDERVHRPTLLPKKVCIGGRSVVFPQDEEKGGTWIAMGESGIVACLLNGGFVKHSDSKRNGRSRGQVVLDVFRIGGIDQFIHAVDLEDVEPFTLILFCALTNSKAYELVWDGTEKHVRKLDLSISMIWSSSTLYSDEIKQKRTTFFTSWIERNTRIDRLSIHELHAAKADNNGFILNGQEDLKTVSVTQLIIEKEKGTMHYTDIQSSKKTLNQQVWSKTSQFC